MFWKKWLQWETATQISQKVKKLRKLNFWQQSETLLRKVNSISFALFVLFENLTTNNSSILIGIDALRLRSFVSFGNNSDKLTFLQNQLQTKQTVLCLCENLIKTMTQLKC